MWEPWKHLLIWPLVRKLQKKTSKLCKYLHAGGPLAMKAATEGFHLWCAVSCYSGLSYLCCQMLLQYLLLQRCLCHGELHDSPYASYLHEQTQRSVYMHRELLLPMLGIPTMYNHTFSYNYESFSTLWHGKFSWDITVCDTNQNRYPTLETRTNVILMFKEHFAWSHQVIKKRTVGVTCTLGNFHIKPPDLILVF